MNARLHTLTRRHLHRDAVVARFPRTEAEAKADPLDWADPAVVNAVLDAPASPAAASEAAARATERAFYVALVAIAAFFALLSWFDQLPPNGVTP